MVNWYNIDTVLLDMDGTLLDLHFDNYFWRTLIPQYYADKHQMTFDSAKSQLEALFDAKQGELQYYCLDYWCDTLAIDIVGLKQQLTDKIVPRPYALEFLQWLEQQQKQVFMVTNAHRDSLDLKMAIIDLRPHFKAMISSHDYGYAKEHQNFWRQLNTAHPFSPEKTLLVDDSHAVLGSAQTYGIQNLLSIAQPDSRVAPRENEPFTSIRCYQTLMNQAEA